jgi:murein DD-endopeptidase MepM/ murein hydrolase activator NlpD
MLVKTAKGFKVTAGYHSINSVHHTPHTGIDLQMGYGTDVLSPVNGIISRTVDYGSQNIGKGVMIKFDDGKELIFGHLSKINVHKGDVVSIGAKIGEVGSTGHSTGNHLHLGLKNLYTGDFLDPSIYERSFQKLYMVGTTVADATVNHSHHLDTVISLAQMLFH